MQSQRCLLILLNVVKALATGGLQKTRRSLQSVTPEVFHVVASIYIEKVRQWSDLLGVGSNNEGSIRDAFDQSLMALKVLRRLIIAGFEHPNRDAAIQEFWAVSLTHFGNFYSLTKRDPPDLPSYVVNSVEKHILQLSKLHTEMAKAHPASFALLPNCISLVQSYWGLVIELGKTYGSSDLSKAEIGTDGDADDEEKNLVEKIGLKALLLVRSCAKMVFQPIHTFKYQTPEDKEEKSQAVQLVKSQLLTEDFVIQVMELLVTRFFVFRPSDLREWEEEPEEWEKREEEIVDAWEFSIRSCSEKLFLDLVINFKNFLAPKLLSVFYSYASEYRYSHAHLAPFYVFFANRFSDPQNQEVLLKDSLYSAIGLAAACLENQLDINSFLVSTLIPEVQIQQPGYNLLRRRIAILLGQWAPVKSDELNQAAIYQIFNHLLKRDDPVNDQVVRVTAGRQLKNILDPYEFTAEGFLPYANPILSGLLNLIQEVNLTETKMALLNTIRVAVVKLEDHVTPPKTSYTHFFELSELTHLLPDITICRSDNILIAYFVGTVRR